MVFCLCTVIWALMLRDFCSFSGNTYVKGLSLFLMWNVFRLVTAGRNFLGGVICKLVNLVYGIAMKVLLLGTSLAGQLKVRLLRLYFAYLMHLRGVQNGLDICFLPL